MSKTTIALLLAAFFLAACTTKEGADSDHTEASAEAEGGLETVEKEDNYGHLERYERRASDYAREGRYTKLDSLGNILETATYKNDTLHGIRVLFYETGDTQIVEQYDMGEFSGPYRLYYPEAGQLELQGQFVANTMDGEWVRYYETGELMEKVTFRDNEENGPFVEFYKNGNLKAEGTYLEGDNEHGLLKMYNEEGELVKTMDCKHGVCHTMWTAEEEVQ